DRNPLRSHAGGRPGRRGGGAGGATGRVVPYRPPGARLPRSAGLPGRRGASRSGRRRGAAADESLCPAPAGVVAAGPPDHLVRGGGESPRCCARATGRLEAAMTAITLTKHHGLGNDFLILLDLAAST